MSSARPTVRLRPMLKSDLPALYEQQADPVAAQLAAFTPRAWPAFIAHWHKVLADSAVTTRTVMVDDQVGGSVLCFLRDGDVELGYWVAREHWGRGVATAAVPAFLREVRTRPLMAYVATHNLASRRVLVRCGFQVLRVQAGAPGPDGQPVDDVVLRLD